MTATLASIRDATKTDLRETGAGTWTDAQVDRAIADALREYGEAAPQELRVDYLVPAASKRTLDLTLVLAAGDFDGLLRIDSIEYPIGQWPPEYLRFDKWGKYLTIHSDAVLDNLTVRIAYATTHTLSASASTVPQRHAELLTLGATGFALRQLAAGVHNQITVHDDDARRADALAEPRLAAFREGCRRLASRVRVSAVYRPSEPHPGRDVVQGP